MNVYQPWSFWLAWIILIAGVVAVAAYVSWAERRDARGPVDDCQHLRDNRNTDSN